MTTTDQSRPSPLRRAWARDKANPYARQHARDEFNAGWTAASRSEGDATGRQTRAYLRGFYAQRMWVAGGCR